MWQSDDGSLLVATTDFFTPIVDDARDFGRIAAANALSDIYAMGARPLFALNILAAPPDKTSQDAHAAHDMKTLTAQVMEVMEGGAAMCAEANTPIVGGHSIHTSEFVYGLAVIGRTTPEQLRRNDTARDGDALILSKPLGTGILSAAHRRGEGSDEAYAEMLHWMTKLNDVGAQLADLPSVNALTDVSGFGLLGHLNEMCQGAQLGVDLCADDVPIMHAASSMIDQGVLNKQLSGGAKHNLHNALIQDINALPVWRLNVLADPQTSGGLLVACEHDSAGEVVSLLRAAGFDSAATIGRFRCGNDIRIVG